MTSAPTKTHRWLAFFFAFGVSMCVLTITLLLFPGTTLDTLWRLNPDAYDAFHSIGNWSIAIMLVVGTTCLFAVIGLWRGAHWGTRLAIFVLSVNMLGDLINTLFRYDYRALIGLPIAAGIILHLLRSEKLCSRPEHV